MRRRLVVAGVTSVLALGGIVLGGTPAGAAVPGNVTNVTATPSQTSVQLNWTPPTTGGFAGVHICRVPGAVAPASNCTGVNVGKGKGSHYTDTYQLLPNTQYTYGLFAYNLSGQLASGASVTTTTLSAETPPANVTGLTATPTSTSVTLNWTDPTAGTYASLYICRAPGAAAPTLPCGGITLAAGTTSYVDSTQLLSGTQYTYSVFTSTASGTPSSGAHVTTTTLAAAAPPNVTGLTATPTSTSVTLNWTNPNPTGTFAGVYICRAQGAVAPTLPCGGVTVAAPTATYTDSASLLPGTQYSYTVFSSTASGVTSSGAHVTVSTLQGSAPPNVTGLTATPTSTSVTLNWTNPNPQGSFAGVYICRAQGAVAPTLPCGGVTVAAPTASYADSFQLVPGTQYTYTVFSSTASGITSSGVHVTTTTNP